MADREKIKTGMVELMKMRLENLAMVILQEKNSKEVRASMEEYREAEKIAVGLNINTRDNHQRFIELEERYSREHSGVML